MTSKPIRIEGDVAYVPLTRGYEAIIDAADVPLVEEINWWANVQKRTVYAHAWGPRPRRLSLLLHRIISAAPAGTHVDHINGDGLDNRKVNLRVCSPAENSKNSRTRLGDADRLKGAFFIKQKRRWQSQIMANGKKKHLGYYDNAEAAHEAYCHASEKLHGEFGRVK